MNKLLIIGILTLGLIGCGDQRPVGTVEVLSGVTPKYLEMQIHYLGPCWKVQSITKVDQMYKATIIKIQ